MTTVYKIRKSGHFSGAYSVSRHETWTVIKDKTFETKDEAVQYIIKENIRTASPTFLDDLIKKRVKRHEVLHDVYLIYQSHFIGFPPVKRISERLALDGVDVENRIKR